MWYQSSVTSSGDANMQWVVSDEEIEKKFLHRWGRTLTLETRESLKKSAQLQKDKESLWENPSMIDLARLPNTANGCKPKPRNWQASMSSRVSNKDVHLGEHRKQKPFLKFNVNAIVIHAKSALYSAIHDVVRLEYLSRLNPRAYAQNKDAIIP
ncbi:hypothetical protein Tco_1253580 [Tanacetum coccineum]